MEVSVSGELKAVEVGLVELLVDGSGVLTTGGIYLSTLMPKDMPFWMVIYNNEYLNNQEVPHGQHCNGHIFKTLLFLEATQYRPLCLQ